MGAANSLPSSCPGQIRVHAALLQQGEGFAHGFHRAHDHEIAGDLEEIGFLRFFADPYRAPPDHSQQRLDLGEIVIGARRDTTINPFATASGRANTGVAT